MKFHQELDFLQKNHMGKPFLKKSVTLVGAEKKQIIIHNDKLFR